jgi:hypothetical protein
VSDCCKSVEGMHFFSFCKNATDAAGGKRLFFYINGL